MMSDDTPTPLRTGRDWRRRPPAPGLGEAIRTARLARGLSQELLAEATKIDRGSINRYEAGTREPSRSSALSLAAVLGDDVMIAAGFIPPGYTAVKRRER